MATKNEARSKSDPTGSVWRLARATGETVAPVLLFGPDGAIGGVEDASARRWTLRDDELVILADDGVAKLAFSGGDPTSAARLVGGVVGGPAGQLALERIALPSGRTIGLPAHAETTEIVRDRVSAKRENLVIIRAGKGSLHRDWARDLADADRNWDLFVSWYDDADPDPTDDCDYLAIQRDVRKFAAFHQIFETRPDFREYRQVWLPDDDLAVSRSAINHLFEICRRHRLDLAQPALDEASHLTYPITRKDPRFTLRFTNFVEVMCPVFSADALAVCIEGFRSTVSSWGLDLIWPSLLSGVGRIAIVDDVTVTHTRPVGGLYDRAAAFAEMQDLLRAYGRDPERRAEPVVFGGCFAGTRL
ncbi:MAG: DUF707 domain-containing protein [Hyphomicrobiales bacterium]|nr:DUF707 domain-containing protein [Hyphomicrobiales bacterium]